MLKPMEILMVGVGGQGTILASKVLSRVAMVEGYDIKVSEIHGMAQRGGSVVTQVRLGEKVYSPLIEEGRADFILAFERLEGLRWLTYLKPGGEIIINDQAILPVPVLSGMAVYPEGIAGYIGAQAGKTTLLNALKIATDCGNARAVNVVLLGVLASKLPMPRQLWENALEETVPARFLEVNKAAFEAGYNLNSKE